MQIYLITLIGGFLGFWISYYTQIHFHIPFIFSIFIYLIVLFSIVFILKKNTRPNLKEFYFNNEILIKRLFIVLIVIWNIILATISKNNEFVFLGVIPTILIFGIYWAVKGNSKIK